MSYDDPRGAPAARPRGAQGRGSPVAPPATRCSSARSIATATLDGRGSPRNASRSTRVDLGDLGLDEGGAPADQAGAAPSAPAIDGARDAPPSLAVDLPAWCRAQGARLIASSARRAGVVAIGAATRSLARRRARRRTAAPRRSSTRPRAGGSRRAARWSRRARRRSTSRSSRSERRSGPTRRRGSTRRRPPRSGIRRPRSRGTRRSTHPAEVEDAVVQVMTYLIENETAALLVPARFLGAAPSALSRGDAAPRDPGRRRGAPHRGVHAARAAPPRRARPVHRRRPGLARDAVRRARLRDRERSCSRCSGEGSFLALLWFLRDHAPDPCTREVARLAAQDEARHVAFGLAHLRAPRRRGSRRCASGSPPRSSAATPRSRTPRASTTRCSTRSSCSPPAAGSRPRSAAGTPRSSRSHREMDARSPAAPRSPRVRRRRRGRRSPPLHTRNFM